MESQIIDYYNELPHGINVIDKMNEELSELQEKIDRLPSENYMKKFQMPSIIFNTIEEYRKFHKRLDEFSRWISDYHAADILIESEEDINYLILRLNFITAKGNPEWCEYRIQSAIDLYNAGLGYDEDDNKYILKNYILGSDERYVLPITYCELSKLHKPDWFYSDDNKYHNIYEIGFLKCNKCNRILDCYDIDDNKKDNDDCSDCFLD